MDKFEKAFKEAPFRASQNFATAIQKTVFLVESKAKRNAPVNKQTGGGNLRQSIGGQASGLTGIVDVRADYALPVHEGARPHTIRPVNKKALANRRTGQFFGKLVHHPGQRAQPFLRDAVEQSTQKINGFFLEAIRNIIKL